MKSCLQLVQYEESICNIKRKLIKRRLKFYNKFPLHLLQTGALNKLISMGFKSLLYCSHTFYQILLQCADKCLSRMEFSEFFSCVQEQSSFISNQGLVEQIQQLHEETLSKINNNEVVHDLYKQASMKEVLDTFWNHVDEHVIIRTQDTACVIYGFNKNTSKYYGMLEPIQHNKQMDALITHHALPGKLCVGIELYDKGRMIKTYQRKSHNNKVQNPVAPLCHSHKQQYNFTFLGLEEHGFAYKVNAKAIQIEAISTFTNISHHQKTNIDKDQAVDIFDKYSQHSAPIQNRNDMKLTTLIHLIAFSRNKTLTLYDSANNIKYQQACSQHQFGRLPKHLRLLQFKKCKGIYVKPKGVYYSELQPLIQIVLMQTDGLIDLPSNEKQLNAVADIETNLNEGTQSEIKIQTEAPRGTTKQKTDYVKVLLYDEHQFRFKSETKYHKFYVCKSPKCNARLQVDGTIFELLKEHQ